jgi:isoleucyl-tRNA synthetase
VLTVTVEGVAEDLTRDDLLIDMAQLPGYVSQADKDVTVVMDTNLTPELVEEGFVREIISKIQTMRKESDFEVMDRIRVYVSGNDKIAEIAKKNDAEIRRVVLADEILTGTMNNAGKEWNLNGEDVTLGVERV